MLIYKITSRDIFHGTCPDVPEVSTMIPGENKIPPVKYHTLTLTPLLISVGSITVLFTSLASQDCVAILHNWEYFTYPYHLVTGDFF
ncbi:hypothetical protein LZ32DRAFT_58225 [Colletotrichum eremochloae]|nr:hypothetical protein LZ32DRAFT_58225 [Colletotrichum eremochloae]